MLRPAMNETFAIATRNRAFEARFKASPEAAALETLSLAPHLLLMLACVHHGVGYDGLTREIVDDVVFDRIPREHPWVPDHAPDAIASVFAFLRFLSRVE